MKYFSDNEQEMPPCTLTEINVDIWNVPSTSLYSPNVLRYYRKCFWNSKSKLAASPNGDKPFVPLGIGGCYGQITIKVEISQFSVVKMQVLGKIK